MPGPVSDSYDPEFGTQHNADIINIRLATLYHKVSTILENKPPLPILELIEAELYKPIVANLTEKEWRLLRFALERAIDSI